MYKNLSDYIDSLEKIGELVRISAPVSSIEEIAEITDRESKRADGGRALLFENSGTEFPVVTNMMGSDRRIAAALGVGELSDLTSRIESMFKELTSPKPSFTDKLRMLPTLAAMSRWLPRSRSGRGACQDVVWLGEEASLDRLPILKCWPHDGGRFVTLPMVNTLDPNTGTRNVGMYRMQVFSPHTTGMHWHLHKTGDRHYREYQHLGRRMPISVCIGGDPAYTYAATAPMPDNMDEYLLAGFLRGRAVELVRSVTNEIMVPADCDFVIEGYVDPCECKVIEGPFGDHTGFYSLEDLYPVFHVTAITHRRGAIYPATLVGIPPQEDAYIAKATERIFLAPIRAVMLPEIKDLYMPAEGVAHNIAIVNISKSYSGQGIKAASSMWGAGQMMFNKFMVITSTDQDIRALQTLRELITKVDVSKDILLWRGPLDVLDHAAPEMGFGGKMAFDLTSVETTVNMPHRATRSTTATYIGVENTITADEAAAAENTHEAANSPENPTLCGGISSVDCSLTDSWSTLILYAKEGTEVDFTQFLQSNAITGVKFTLIMDSSVEGLSRSDILWLAASNCDPGRDVKIENGMVLFDCRAKAGGINGFTRPWPNVVASSQETIALVDRRWSEYRLGEFTPSPSLKYLKLQRQNSAYYRI